MTLVYRAPKLQENRPLDTPSPTAYNTLVASKQANGSSCFKSKVARQEQQHSPTRHVGPGSYFHDKTEEEQKGNMSAVFSSKIQRFKSPQQPKKDNSSQDTLFQEINQIMKKNEPPKQNTGKLITNKQRKEKEKDIGPQRLPSIPNQEQSYGYRYDGDSDKLINNDNPKIMFAKKGLVLEEDFYFQRTQSQLGKGPKCTLNSHVPRASPQIKHQVDGPDPGAYHPQKYTSIQNNVKNMSSTAVSFKQKFHQLGSNRQKLLMSKLKKQFKDYLPDQMTLAQLEQEKFQERSKKGSPETKSKEKQQFFLTKEARFRVTKKDKISTNKSIKTQDSINQKSIEVNVNKKEPFSVGQTRFKQSSKENLGPGSYDYTNSRSNSISILRKEQRFRGCINPTQTPGPGAYDTTQKSKDQKNRVPFNRFVCHMLKEDPGQHRFSSMEEMYGKVGRHLNYLSKIEKIGSKNSINVLEKAKKQPNCKMMGLAKVKSSIIKAVTEQNDAKLTNKEKEKNTEKSHPKYQHLYEYKKPKQVPSSLGPGCYEIATTLDKKSFNQSPPPVYC